MTTLDELAVKFRTDKSSKGHDYCGIYETYLGALQDKPITFLEIGIENGFSMRMWREWFTQARIFGLDIMKLPAFDGVTYMAGDQGNPETIRELVATTGPLDVVIDDGGHIASAVIASFEMLWPHVKAGGLYVVEDLHVGYERLGTSKVSALDYFGTLEEPQYADRQIFKKNICFIRKPL